MKIQLGPWKVEVALTSVEDMERCYGDWDEQKKLIRIRDNLSALEMCMTLIHEMFHAISDLHYLRLSEQSVRALENTVTQLIQNSPDLAYYVVKAISKRDYDPDTRSTLAGPSTGWGHDSPSEADGPSPKAPDDL